MISPSTLRAAEVERIIEATLTKQAQHGSWTREPSLTNAWMVELNAAGVTQSPDADSALAFSCHEFIGTRETVHGDIGVVVKLTLPNGQTVKGFTAIEAKRSFDTGDKYAGLRFDQLKLQLTHTTYHHVLLYSRQKVCLPSGGDSVHAILVPTRLVVALSDQSAQLETAGLRLGAQLERLFLGHDLDFSETTVNAVLSGRKAYRALLVAHHSRGKPPPDLGDMQPAPSCYQKVSRATRYRTTYTKSSTEQHIQLGEPLPTDAKTPKKGGPSR